MWRHDAECEKQFLVRQSEKGKKSGVIRKAKIEPLQAQALRLSQEHSLNQEQIAQRLGKDQSTISRWLKILKGQVSSPPKSHQPNWFQRLQTWLALKRKAVHKMPNAFVVDDDKYGLNKHAENQQCNAKFRLFKPFDHQMSRYVFLFMHKPKSDI